VIGRVTENNEKGWDERDEMENAGSNN